MSVHRERLSALRMRVRNVLRYRVPQLGGARARYGARAPRCIGPSGHRRQDPMRNPLAMRGTIVLDNAPGRALRKAPAAVRVRDVLWCAGGFHAGDPVYLTFRAVDGGQYLVATGIVRCDAAGLSRRTGARPQAAPDGADERPDDDAVIRAEDVEVLWPPA
jgi:glutamate 5-kinase